MKKWMIEYDKESDILRIMEGSKFVVEIFPRDEARNKKSDEVRYAKEIVLSHNNYNELVYALKELTENIHLSKLNIRKDFSLINAHAYATKILSKQRTMK